MLVSQSYHIIKNNSERNNCSILGSMVQFMPSLKIEPNSIIFQIIKLHLKKKAIYTITVLPWVLGDEGW